MEKFSIIIAIGVLVSSFLSDIIWVFYIRRTSENKPLQAATFSSLIILIGAFVILSYVGNNWYLVPAAIGAFFGTYFTMKFDIKNGRPQHKK